MVTRAAFSSKGRGKRRAVLRHFQVVGAIRASDLSAAVRHVLRSIEDHADNDTGTAYPSLATMATETGLGRSTVKRSLHEAAALGWVRWIRHGSPDKTNLYIVTPPGLAMPWFKPEAWPDMTPEDFDSAIG